MKVELLRERDDSGRLVAVRHRRRSRVCPTPSCSTLFSGVRTLGRTTRDRARGTGLGLSLVSGLAEAMGGRVWYELRSGVSSFNLALDADSLNDSARVRVRIRVFGRVQGVFFRVLRRTRSRPAACRRLRPQRDATARSPSKPRASGQRSRR